MYKYHQKELGPYKPTINFVDNINSHLWMGGQGICKDLNQFTHLYPRNLTDDSVPSDDRMGSLVNKLAGVELNKWLYCYFLFHLPRIHIFLNDVVVFQP